MRKKFIGANWKMNLLYDEAKKLFAELSKPSLSASDAEIVIFPSSIYLSEFARLKGLPLGAQDLCFDDSGAFTGAIAARQLKSISCGESLAVREAEKHLEYIENQLINGFKDLDETELKNCIIAYEPIWAIGTGLNASNSEIEEMHGFIRSSIAKRFSTSLSQSIRIIYGGSCNQDNASEIFSLKDVDGGLIGGASLEFESFEKIIKSL